MQKLKLIQDEYDTKFLSLYELINIFTEKLEIKNRAFYSKINKGLKFTKILRGLSYNEQGLLSFEVVFENYKKAKKTDRIIYQIAPYLSSLSRLLRLIYTQASNMLGEEKTKKILKNSFNLVKKKYKEIPDLEGYIPSGITRKPTLEAATYPTALTDNMIKYIIDTVIGKDRF